MRITALNTILPIRNCKSLPAFKGQGQDTFEKTMTIKGSETQAKIYTYNVDFQTLDKIRNLCNHPVFSDLPIRIMPDAHAEKLGVVGFSAPVGNAGKVIPNIVGGDIGCGMLCIKLDTKGKKIDCKQLDEVIRTYVSSSRKERPKSLEKLPIDFIRSVNDIVSHKYKHKTEKITDSFATIGGGNHFIEVDKDKNGDYYLVIHTGSRLFGKDVAEYHQEIANRQNPYKIKDLSFLSGDEAKQYFEDMKLAIEFSRYNRRIIADEILSRMGWGEVSSFESLHNYISEDGMIRKGAIGADEGKELIIPLNMRDGAILGTGKGNKDWNNTAPHGSGRQFRRSEIKNILSFEEYRDSMEGIYSTCIAPSTLAEAPQAYKPSDEIINNIKDTAQVKEIITPVYNYKD